MSQNTQKQYGIALKQKSQGWATQHNYAPSLQTYGLSRVSNLVWSQSTKIPFGKSLLPNPINLFTQTEYQVQTVFTNHEVCYCDMTYCALCQLTPTTRGILISLSSNISYYPYLFDKTMHARNSIPTTNNINPQY